MDVTYFCATCKAIACPECFFENHNGHDRKILKLIREEVTQEIKDRLDRLKQIENQYKTNEKQVRSELDTIRESHEEAFIETEERRLKFVKLLSKASGTDLPRRIKQK